VQRQPAEARPGRKPFHHLFGHQCENAQYRPAADTTGANPDRSSARFRKSIRLRMSPQNGPGVGIIAMADEIRPNVARVDRVQALDDRHASSRIAGPSIAGKLL
jgi:hypothetical protein